MKALKCKMYIVYVIVTRVVYSIYIVSGKPRALAYRACMIDLDRSARCRCVFKRLGARLADARASEVRVRRLDHDISRLDQLG